MSIPTEYKKIVENGWPEKKDELTDEAKPYWQFKNQLTCIDNFMYKGLKLIIPENLRIEMLTLIHETHLGIVKCKIRAREFMYWSAWYDIRHTIYCRKV